VSNIAKRIKKTSGVDDMVLYVNLDGMSEGEQRGEGKKQGITINKVTIKFYKRSKEFFAKC